VAAWVLRKRSIPLLIVAAAVLCGCANIEPDQRTESDPWESMNRPMYSFNTAVDKVTLKPVAKGYQFIVPQPARTGVSNFFQNLRTPGSAFFNFLQGKPGHGVSEFTRFLLNSTIGIGGLFDVATVAGLEAREEDIDQTAAVWGVPSGPYVMLPIFGPSTLRGAILFPFDFITAPLYFYENSSVRSKLQVLRIIDIRSRLLAAEKFLDDSKDPYITLRESYLQNLEYEVYDGNPPDDDDFLDGLLEDDSFE
jgi:phospholipid-binding lipoprotein MlaA